MEILDIKKLKKLLKGLDLKYLAGEKKDNILDFVEVESNKREKKADYIYYKPCEVVEILENKYYLVLTEIEDIEENIIFSTNAFLITETGGEFKYNDVLIGVKCKGKLYASSNFFNAIKQYRHLFKDDMTQEEIFFVVRDDIGEKANTKIFNIFRVYVNKIFENLAIEEEQQNSLNEQIEKIKGSIFTIEDLEK